MKKTTKLLSVVLALVMMLSTVSVAFAGTLKTDTYNTVEKLISNDSLADIVGQLLTDLNGAKKNVTGTVLRFVFMFVDDENLAKHIGKTDVTKASDEALAKILLDWLDTDILPEFGSVLPENITKIVNGIPGLTVDLTSVNGVLGTLSTVCDLTNGLLDFGILNKLNGKAIEGKKRSGGDLNVIYALLQWLSDNKGAIQKAVKGNLDLGIIGDFVDVSEYEGIIKNLPNFLKSYIFQLVDGYAKAGDIKDDPTGDWGKNANYNSFNADELLAAALLKLVKNDKEVVITKTEADDALKKSFYAILAENLDDLFANYDAAEWLNENVPKFINDISVTDAIKAVFNTSIAFDNNTFADIFAGAPTTGILGQVNNLLCKVAEIALKPAEFKKLALVKGGNENLNANLKKVCRYILPLMANKTVSDKLGYDFTMFTASAVKTMELKDMAVAILKIFFGDWFENANKTTVANAKTLEDLGALAVYYTATSGRLPFEVKASAPKAGLTSDEATKYILDTGALIGLNALKYNGDKIYFSTNVTSGYENIADEISDWGLNFVKGIPAVIVQEKNAKRMTNTRNTYDDVVNGGAFYKLNVVLNELVDFSFFTNDAGDYDKAPTTFKFDLGLFLTNTLLDNIYDFDLAGLLGAFKKNDSSTLGKTVISAVLSIVDRAVTALFKHTDKASSGTLTAKTDNLVVGTEKVCTKQVTKTFTNYDTVSGHYLSTSSAKTTEKTNATHDNSIRIANVVATCAKEGYSTVKCSVCGNETTTKKAKTTHTYKDGKCTVCGAADPNYKATPDYKLGDIDANNKVEAADARLALRASVGLEKYNAGTAQFLAADVDLDNKISSSDARLILRFAVGLEKKLGK